jgi:hypothetical protein
MKYTTFLKSMAVTIRELNQNKMVAIITKQVNDLDSLSLFELAISSPDLLNSPIAVQKQSAITPIALLRKNLIQAASKDVSYYVETGRVY